MNGVSLFYPNRLFIVVQRRQNAHPEYQNSDRDEDPSPAWVQW
jgi:hypothetical protein